MSKSNKEKEDFWKDFHPRTDEQCREIVRKMARGELINVRPENIRKQILLLIGVLNGYPRSSLDQIGGILGEAGSAIGSMDGLPVFLTAHFYHKDDWSRIASYYTKWLEARKVADQVLNA